MGRVGRGEGGEARPEPRDALASDLRGWRVWAPEDTGRLAVGAEHSRTHQQSREIV